MGFSRICWPVVLLHVVPFLLTWAYPFWRLIYWPVVQQGGHFYKPGTYVWWVQNVYGLASYCYRDGYAVHNSANLQIQPLVLLLLLLLPTSIGTSIGKFNQFFSCTD